MIYDEANFRLLNPPSGMEYLCSTRPRSAHPFFGPGVTPPGFVAFEDSGIAKVSRSELYDRAVEAKAKRQRPMDWIRPPMQQKNQAQTNFCWGNGPAGALSIVAAQQGNPFKEPSAASICCLLTNYRNEGGWGIDWVKYAADVGPCDTDLWPNAAISRNYDTPESRADRPNHKVVEWIDLPPRDFLALASCILPPHCCPCPVGYDWWGHEVEGVGVEAISRTEFGLWIWNSWKNVDWGEKNQYGVDGFGLLAEGKGTPDDAQAVRIATPGGG